MSEDYLDNRKKERQWMFMQLEMAKAFRIIRSLYLDEFITQLEKSLSFTPFVDPTLWINKQKDGERWLRTAKALREARDKILQEFKEGI